MNCGCMDNMWVKCGRWMADEGVADERVVDGFPRDKVCALPQCPKSHN